MFRKSILIMGLLLWSAAAIWPETDSLNITITIAPGVGIVNEQFPETFEVSNPYPNPFNPSTRFSLALPAASEVEIQIYNVLGQRVTELGLGEYPAGYHSVVWRAEKNVPSGLYLIRVQSLFGISLSKVLLLK